MAESFPFDRPVGSDASMFIQWKGTAVCLDFICDACGTSGHVDGFFAYFVECGHCGAVYQMGTQVIAKRVKEATGPSVLAVDSEDEDFR